MTDIGWIERSNTLNTPTEGPSLGRRSRTETAGEPRPMNRRQFVNWSLATAAAMAAASSCSSDQSAAPSTPAGTAGDEVDFSARFSGFEAADEPNGDLSKVMWPSFVTDGGPEVQALYEFQITHGELMRYMPCFCGCGQGDGHRNNRDCYVESVGSDGSVVLDSMAPT